jgi:lipoprotein signal peptidase
VQPVFFWVLLRVTTRKKVGATVVLLLLTVVALDQLTKWWAWRHAPEPSINGGGNPFVGPVIGSWYADPLTGALLDVVDVGVLSAAAAMLVRATQPTINRVSAALMIAGWSSNLLDRLCMHHVTAPGSNRGAIDFIHVGQYYYNVADFFIGIATPIFLVAGGYRWFNRRSSTVPPPRRETV